MAPGPHLRAAWKRSSLATRFGVAGGVVLVAAALFIGAIVTARIEQSVVRNTAAATALYMESVISPISQQLEASDRLSPTAERALDEVFTNTPLGARVVSYKIWKADGLVVESSDETLIGRRFAPSDGLIAASEGRISAEFDAGDTHGEGGPAEDGPDQPLLEIYSPIRAAWSGDVIAVAEFYEQNPQLADDLRDARRSAWLTVAGCGLALGAALYLIVLNGSRTIERQRRDLDARLADLRALSDRNRDLRLRVVEAAGRAATTGEHMLRRIGADLHDGPAQYLAFAALRLDDLYAKQTSDDARAELKGVKGALESAMGEVRAMSRGLTLPDIAGKPIAEAVRRAAEEHRARTGEPVELHLQAGDAPWIGQAMRICAYRFVQEGLNNAGRHAGGQGLCVEQDLGPDGIIVRVRDSGPGLPSGQRFGLGLTGLRDRVESLGGTFSVGPAEGGGTELTMTLHPGERT